MDQGFLICLKVAKYEMSHKIQTLKAILLYMKCEEHNTVFRQMDHSVELGQMGFGQAWKEQGLSPLYPQQLLGQPCPPLSVGLDLVYE